MTFFKLTKRHPANHVASLDIIYTFIHLVGKLSIYPSVWSLHILSFNSVSRARSESHFNSNWLNIISV